MTEIARLCALVEELKEENRQLREALTPPARLPADWRLTPQEIALLLTLYGSATIVRFEALALGLSRGSEPLSDEHIAVLVSKVRRKLRERGVGVRIINRWGVGYGLDDASRSVIAAALAAPSTQRVAA